MLMQDTTDAVQISARTWLKKDFIRWIRLSTETRVGSGPWRTKALLIREDDFRTSCGIDGSESNRVEDSNGRNIRFTDPHPPRHIRLVSIMGPRNLLSSLPDGYHGPASFPPAFKRQGSVSHSGKDYFWGKHETKGQNLSVSRVFICRLRDRPATERYRKLGKTLGGDY